MELIIPELPDIAGQPRNNNTRLLKAIFIPDMIEIDLTIGPTMLAGQDGFDRLPVSGGDVIDTAYQPMAAHGDGRAFFDVPRGWSLQDQHHLGRPQRQCAQG